MIAVGEESAEVFTGRTAVATAALLGQEAAVFPSHHGGFLDGEFGYPGKPVEFAARLRELLACLVFAPLLRRSSLEVTVPAELGREGTDMRLRIVVAAIAALLVTRGDRVDLVVPGDRFPIRSVRGVPPGSTSPFLRPDRPPSHPARSGS